MMNKLSDLVENNLNRIIGKGIKPSLLVAVSGGMDSMCLLDILHHLGHHVSVAHVNYNLRGEDSKLDKELSIGMKGYIIVIEIYISTRYQTYEQETLNNTC